MAQVDLNRATILESLPRGTRLVTEVAFDGKRALVRVPTKGLAKTVPDLLENADEFARRARKIAHMPNRADVTFKRAELGRDFNN